MSRSFCTHSERQSHTGTVLCYLMQVLVKMRCLCLTMRTVTYVKKAAATTRSTTDQGNQNPKLPKLNLHTPTGTSDTGQLLPESSNKIGPKSRCVDRKRIDVCKQDVLEKAESHSQVGDATGSSVTQPTSQSHCSRSLLVPRSRETPGSSRKLPRAEQNWRLPAVGRDNTAFIHLLRG